MKDIEIILAALTAITLFVFGLENFSRELQKISGEKFRRFMAHATRFSGVGLLIGAAVTAVIQSSSATSVIAISLVNAGVLSFRNSVGIILGSNIGTTITAQLIAFKLTAFAPVFILLGFFLSLLRTKYAIFGKSLFYFGFVFFSLNLISSSLAPLQEDQRVLQYLFEPQHPVFGVLLGCLVTALLQSSSVTTGLTIIFAQQSLISVHNAIPILMGANIGTTATALIAILNMDVAAKKTALSHFLFNVGGVLLFLPLLFLLPNLTIYLGSDPAIALANFHLVFNVTTSLLFLSFLKPFTRLIDQLLGEGQMDFERLDLSKLDDEKDELVLEEDLRQMQAQLFCFVQENYSLVTLSIESRYRSVAEAAKKRIDYVTHVRGEVVGFFASMVGKKSEEKRITNIVDIMNLFEYVFQISDSVNDLMHIKETMDRHYIEIKSDLLLELRKLSSQMLGFFELIAEGQAEDVALRAAADELQQEINQANKHILRLSVQQDRADAGALLQLITYHQRLRDKLVNYHKLRSRRCLV